jgi:hypothetical protein
LVWLENKYGTHDECTVSENLENSSFLQLLARGAIVKGTVLYNKNYNMGPNWYQWTAYDLPIGRLVF